MSVPTEHTPARIKDGSPTVAAVDEAVLLREYARAARPDLEDELVRRFEPFTRSLAMRYRGGSEAAEDLLQVASLGLVKALRKYDPERGSSFKAYAAPTILGELRRHFRDHCWRLHMPRSLQENSLAVERASRELTEQLGGSPTVAQIAARLELTEEDVLQVLEARESQRAVSLDAPVRREEPQTMPRVETMGDPEPGFDAVEAQLAIEKCAGLTDEERIVVGLRFVKDLNQYEIGSRMGISQMQVSRILRRGLAKLLEAVQGDEAPEGRRTFTDTSRDPRFPRGRVRRRSRRAAAAA